MSEVAKGFDQKLWEGGVADGAFSGEKDPDGAWYLLEVGGEKVALAAAVPGPADLTNVSYYVHPDHRGLGYGTKIASKVTDLHEKATFTIFKDNDVSIKVALAALRNKFSMTMGHNVVRLTKTADAIPGGKADKKKPSDFDAATLAEGAKHEREHTSSDAIAQEIAMDHLTEDSDYYKKLRKIEKKSSHNAREVEKPKPKGPPLVTYLDDIAILLKNMKSDAPAVGEEVAKVAGARELLKLAISARAGMAVNEARTIQSKLKGLTSPQAVDRRISDAAGRVAKAPTTPLSPEDRKRILKASRYVRVNVQDPKGGEIYKRIMSKSLNKDHQMELPA